MLVEMEKPDYWKSPAGINERIAMISGDFTFRVYNNALAFYGDVNYSGLQWTGYQDSATCKVCDKHIEDAQKGQLYYTGQYIPKLPAHNNCRCTWKLIPKENK
jgi:hypothetical protein